MLKGNGKWIKNTSWRYQSLLVSNVAIEWRNCTSPNFENWPLSSNHSSELGTFLQGSLEKTSLMWTKLWARGNKPELRTSSQEGKRVYIVLFSPSTTGSLALVVVVDILASQILGSGEWANELSLRWKRRYYWTKLTPPRNHQTLVYIRSQLLPYFMPNLTPLSEAISLRPHGKRPSP